MPLKEGNRGIRRLLPAIYRGIIPVATAKWVIVVDDDIDIYDTGQEEWALAVRVQPHRDIIITDNNCQGVSFDPSIHPDIRKIPYTRASKIGIDATTRFKGHDFGQMVIDSEEIQQKITGRWKEYGLK